jgi:hypothetical protein
MSLTSWSDPNPSNQTLSALSSQYQTNLSPIFAAIMEDRRRQQQMEQQQMQQMMSQIGSGVSQVAGAYGKSAQAGQADDAANRAIYMSQNPGSMQQLSSMGADQFDQTYVPDYGGTGGAQAYRFMQDQEKRDLQNELEQQKIDAIQKKLSGTGGFDGGLTPGQAAVEHRFEARQQQQSLQDEMQRIQDENEGRADYFKKYGLEPQQAAGIPQLQDGQTAMNPYGTTDKKFPMSKEELDALRQQGGEYSKEQDRIKEIQSQLEHRGTSASSRLNQGDVDQAMQAMGVGGSGQKPGNDAYAQAIKILQENGKPTTDANIKYVMDQLVK